MKNNGHSQKVIKKARRFLTPALAFHTDIVARRAEGLYVTATDGKRYMDLSSGLAVANIGHSHPAVIEAAGEQMKRLIHSGCIFRYEVEVTLAERLAKITPEGIEMFFFSNSGAEAVEGAVKLAKTFTGRQGVISFTGGFHGRTMGAVTLTTSSSKYRKNYHPLLPGVYHSPYPYCYRCPMGKVRKTCLMECFNQLEIIFKHYITPEEVACVVIEPVLGEGGYVPAPPEFIARLKDLTAKHGILFIADEVQSGMGRTGRWFASEDLGLRPDIITIAKGIASGFPLSAVGASRRIMRRWTPGAHGTTFGGNPVACAAALATIETIDSDGLLENARRVGQYATARIKKLRKKYPVIGDVRGPGLMIGVEFIEKDGTPSAKRLKKTMEKCLERGLIIIECGHEKNIARIMPPLNITKSELSSALDIFEEALG